MEIEWNKMESSKSWHYDFPKKFKSNSPF